MRIRRFSGLVLATLGLGFSVLATAATDSLHEGYYVGMGDGAMIAFHVLPGGENAVIGAVEIPYNMSWRPTPPTAKDVIDADKVSFENAYKGPLKNVAPGKYIFTLGSPEKPESYCAYSVQVAPDGGIKLQEAEAKEWRGCMYYHGMTWGFSTTGKPWKRFPMPVS